MSKVANTQPASGSRVSLGRIGPDTWHLLGVVSPGVLWIVIFLVLPGLLLISIAFMTNGPYGLPQMPWSLDAFKQLAGYGLLGWSAGNIHIIIRTVWQSVLATALVTVVAYPIAYYITTRPVHIRPILLLAVVVPSWTNQVIRAMGWMDLLAPQTPLSNFAAHLGFISPHMGLFPSQFAVVIGLIYNFLPFMTLPLYAAFERLDYAQVEAARDLHAGPIHTFWHAVFPQTLPGLVTGVVLVGIPAFGMFVVPKLLGGGKSIMLGNLIARQFQSASNWPYGAAGALIMIVVTLIGLLVMRRISRRAGGGVEVVL